MFYQLYTIHIQGPGIAPACVYGFLPNKTESTYKRFLDILLLLLPNAASDKVLIDFELAAMKAFEKALPNATISGCFFHLSQNFIHKIGELGLKNLYHSNPELSLALKLIPSLAFEKLENVKSSFKLVVEGIHFSRKLQGFSERKFNTVIRTISGFFPSPPHPIPIFQVPDIGNLGKSGFRKS